MTHIEKMKEWLEAIEIAAEGGGVDFHAYAEELRQAIAEAEKQEPVIDKSAAIRIATALGWEPKREWVGLTDEEIAEFDVDPIEAKALIQKLKEKNT